MMNHLYANFDPNALPFIDSEVDAQTEHDFEVGNVTPNHEKAEEAYPTVKAMTCDRISIIAQQYRKSETENGYFIAGIYPNNSESGGFNREQWLAEYEQLIP